MMNKKMKLLIFLSLIFVSVSFSVDKKIEIGIDEQLGNKLPLDAEFYAEDGEIIKLGDLITKTTALAFVYYECPSICSPLMSAMAEVVNRADLKPGEDYNIITISINTDETPAIASEKKKNFLNIIKKDFPENSWHFLTGDSLNILKAANAAGFYFKRENDDFIHSGAVIFVSEDGIISRYLFPQYSDRRGYSILPFDFKMAVIETGKGNLSPTVARVLQFCFSYDPEGKTYILNFTRIFGVGILVLAAAFVVYLRVKPKKDNK